MAMTGVILLLVVLSAHRGTAEISTSDFVVNSYQLSLTVPNTTSVGSALDAQAVITLTCNNASAPIVLNWGSSLLPTSPNSTVITVKKTTTTNTTAVSVAVSVTLDVSKQTITLTPQTASDLAASDTVTVTANYQVTVNAEARGIFMLSFPDGNKTSSFLATNSWPISARDILPCVDQPDATATWSVILTRPTDWELVTSLNPSNSTPDTSTGTTVDTLSTLSEVSLPSSSLSIFLSGGIFVKTTPTHSTNTTTFNFWARSKLNGTTDLTNTISTLTQLFSAVDKVISDQLTSVDVVLVPNLPQPFSSPGIIYIREDSYNVTSPGLVQSVVMPVVWQYIKQYTLFSTRPASWADYWISEALSGFLQYSVLSNIYTGLDIATDLEVVVRQSALALDTSSSSSPLQDTSINTDSPAAIQSSIMDPLKKLKGTAVFNMLDMSLPAGSVLSTIAQLLSFGKGKSISTVESLTGFSTILMMLNLTTQQTQIVSGVSTWINTRGYPLLTALVSDYGTPANVSLKLSTYCDLPSCDKLTAGYLVPATVGSKNDTRYLTPRQDLVVVTADGTNVNLTVNSGDWIASNMQSTGYYRVNYNASNWQLIRSALVSNSSQIPGFSQILDDSMALALAGLLPYSDALQIVSANLKYTQFENWYPVFTNLWRLRDNLLDTDYYTNFENFAKMVLLDARSVLEGNTLNDVEKEKIHALVFEGLCELNIGNYRTQAIDSLSNLLQGNLVSTVGASAYDAMVCCGAQHSSSLNATTLRTTISDSSASFYARHFNAIALGCLASFTDISGQISSFVTATKTRAVSASEIQSKPYITTMYQKIVEKHPKEFIDYLSQNSSSLMSDLQNLLGAPQVASLIVKVGQKINNETYIAKLNSILSNSTGIDATITKALEQTATEVALKVTWLQQNNATLTSALESNTVVSSGFALKTVFSLSCVLPIVICVMKISV